MMKEYMMIFIGPDYGEQGLNLSPEKTQERMGKWFTWHEKMEKEGRVVSGEALHAESKRIVGPNRVVTNGPAVASNEVVGGYYIIKAESMEDAMEVAQGFPDYEVNGLVEIHEVMKFEGM